MSAEHTPSAMHAHSQPAPQDAPVLAPRSAPPPAPPPAPLPGPLGRLASRAYSLALARRNARFDAGDGVMRLDRPVISVGNLSVGGTGKTPMVAWIVGTLRDAGRDPCVAMRGYRARGGISDEAAEHAAAFDELPIVAQPDRAHGLARLFATTRGARIDCVVLDDGFQHRRLARDLDIVLIDATRDPFSDALLPAGWLREPTSALARAARVVITHAEDADARALAALTDRVRDVRARAPAPRHGDPREPIAITRHAWTGLTVFDRAHGAWSPRSEPVAWLRGRRVAAACAIGNPAPFLRAVARACERETPAVVFGDHDPISARTAAQLTQRVADANAEALVVTAKDWTKLRRHGGTAPSPVVVPQLRLEFDRGEAELREAVLAACPPR